MYSTFANELWQELKRFIAPHDKDEAADIVINTLINQDEDLDDIKAVFRNDADIKRALVNYTNDDEVLEESYDEDPDDYDDHWEE